MKQTNYMSQNNPLRSMRLVQRTRIRMMPHQKIILASSVLFSLTLGFVVFINISESGNTSASTSGNGAVKVQKEQTTNVNSADTIYNSSENSAVNKSIADTAARKISDKK